MAYGLRVTCDRCAEDFTKERNYAYFAEELDLIFCPECGEEAIGIYGKDLDPNEVYPEMMGG
jgi:hypothetical protein